MKSPFIKENLTIGGWEDRKDESKIIHFSTGNIIFEYKQENNNIKDTLTKAVENNINLEEAFLIHHDLAGVNLAGANLKGAHFVGANLAGANLENANLENANLFTTNFRGAYLKGANFKNTMSCCADFTGAYLDNANLNGACLDTAFMRGVHLIGADLEGANLTDSYLAGASLKNANFKGANLENAELIGANLEGADLIQIVGIGSIFGETTYDRKNDKIICGSFYGSLDEFEIEVKKTHAEKPKNLKQYIGFINLLRELM